MFKWLDYLIRLAIDAGHDAYRILHGDLWNRSIDARHEEPDGLTLFHLLVLEPASTRDRQMGAWGMENSDVKVGREIPCSIRREDVLLEVEW